MEGQEEQLSHSEQIYNLNDINYDEHGQQYLKNDSSRLRLDPKPLSSEAKALAVELLRRIQFLEQKIDYLESRQRRPHPEKKRNRRRAGEISKLYKCNHAGCGRRYGSQTSLKLHRRVKHGLRLMRRARLEGQAQ